MSGVLLWAGVAVCGGAGAVARVLVERLVTRATTTAFPAGILVVNVSGAAGLGAMAGAGVGREAMLLAGAALLGAYTTFSTWMLDTERLLTQRRLGAAAVNLAGSLAAGLGAAAVARAALA